MRETRRFVRALAPPEMPLGSVADSANARADSGSEAWFGAKL
jgi:hypothetical protein